MGLVEKEMTELEKRVERLEHCVAVLMSKFFEEKELEKYR
tara:strand:- start:167 stop:286 length:120 start_codon:yes stop_codon:yes gene_type:complete